MTDEQKAKAQKAVRRLQDLGWAGAGGAEGILVAFSGGQDSALVARFARDAVGERALAVTVVSVFLADSERERARRVASDIGIAHEELSMDVLGDATVAANPKDRCYHCKRRIFEALTALAEERGLAAVCDGANVDDAADYRPGRRATTELGVVSPLAEAGITKADIRDVSRELGLATWNLPSSACLASRIPYGTPLRETVLKRVEAAEECLRELGIRQCRVRVHGDTARIEVDPANFATVVEHGDRIVADLTGCGFRTVTLDLRGFRSGSLNEGVVTG